MRRVLIGVLTMAWALALAPAAQGDFGLSAMEVDFTEADGSAARQAGSHPFAMRTAFALNTITEKEDAGEYIDGAIRDLDTLTPPGLIGDSAPVPTCSTLQFLESGPFKISACPDSAAIGFVEARINSFGNAADAPPSPVYLLERPPGMAAQIGFWVGGVPLAVELAVSEEAPHNALGRLRNIPAVAEVSKSALTLWGVPADPRHDQERGVCRFTVSADSCPTNVPERPFLTLPRRCAPTLQTIFRATPWWTGNPLAPTPGGEPFEGSALSEGTVGCSRLGFSPRIDAEPTSLAAQSPSGLDFTLRVEDPGLTSPTGLAQSDIEEAVVTLPEGMTANPSLAEGLEACSEAQFEAERADSAPQEGCPQASKIGTVQVHTPLLADPLGGALFIAEPYRNPFDTLLAIYLVIKSAEHGVAIKQALKVEPDPLTGQLTTTATEIPQWPFESFTVHFREGARSPLITPPSCGAHRVEALLTPRAGGAPLRASSEFELIAGPNGGPCPPSGTPPFEPGFSAGTLNNSAASHSPFAMRLTRRDGDQDLVRFDATLPPGLVAKLAGVSRCSDQAIAQIEARTGKEELQSPSCPANSKIGSVQAGAGVGSQLTYVPGSVYLAGPFAGAPLSVVGVVPAVAGPFDVGVVATRQALTLDPVSGEVEVDGARSEPIPHILAGIPLNVRDVQVNVDRPNFTLNPTSCEEMAVGAGIWGGGADPFSLADDSPFARTERFQAANCANLGFRPRLSLRLKGGTKRGGHPALKAVLRPRPGDANLKRTVVKLPRSAFLDQGHIRTICTRVQFAADACPPGSVYGRVTAFTPLLEEPLKGPAYLRSSENNLPDLVFALRGVVEIEASARIDSVGGGIRATFAAVPDAPVSKVVVEMQGAKKGLIVNSRDICAKPSRAEVRLGAHNGKRATLRPRMGARCPKGS